MSTYDIMMNILIPYTLFKFCSVLLTASTSHLYQSSSYCHPNCERCLCRFHCHVDDCSCTNSTSQALPPFSNTTTGEQLWFIVGNFIKCTIYSVAEPCSNSYQQTPTSPSSQNPPPPSSLHCTALSLLCVCISEAHFP